ncbi:MAG: TPM domain-containing protein [Lachnospiraceae bacterium]|nr:TPM domain-containing protein [Lachnospiraceae bacterium]
MKKRALTLIMMLLLVAFSTVTVFAATTSTKKVIDNDGLLSSSEAGSLESKLKQLSNGIDMDVAVVTVSEIPDNYSQFGDSAARKYAHDVYEAQGYSEDGGIMLLICKATGDAAFSTMGKGIEVFTDSAQNSIMSAMRSDLSAGNFASAFDKYTDKVNAVYNDYAENNGEKPFRFGLLGGISSAIGALVGAIRSGSLKSQLRSVYKKDEAQQYIKSGSFKLNKKIDIETYKEVHREKIQKQPASTTETSSSGKTHGGTSHKF